MHLLEISILSLNNVIVRPTNIVNIAKKNWAHFYKTKFFRNQSFQTISLIKVDLQAKYSSQKKKQSERFGSFLLTKNDFESKFITNFANFEEVVHNFGRSDDGIIL